VRLSRHIIIEHLNDVRPPTFGGTPLRRFGRVGIGGVVRSAEQRDGVEGLSFGATRPFVEPHYREVEMGDCLRGITRCPDVADRIAGVQIAPFLESVRVMIQMRVVETSRPRSIDLVDAEPAPRAREYAPHTTG
jgi:hypothetical protein